MSDVTVSRRLREARRATREDLPALAKRIGVREEYLRAIEQGRLADLPSGIYGRAAVRSFAAACGFDPAAILAECESELTPVEEPISALGRLRGIRQPAAPPAPAAAGKPGAARNAPDSRLAGSVSPSWRLLAAATLDACVVAALLLLVVACAITAMMVPLAALDHSGPAFGLMGLLLGSAYFVWFGGLSGRTVGEHVLRVEPRNTDRASLTLRAIGARALLAATRDTQFIQAAGEWVGNTARERFGARSAPQPEPLPSAPVAWPRIIGTTGGDALRQKQRKRFCRIDRLVDDDPQDAAVTRAAVVTAFRKVEGVVRAAPQR
jgi:helix-turn-helix protein